MKPAALALPQPPPAGRPSLPGLPPLHLQVCVGLSAAIYTTIHDLSTNPDVR